MKMDKELNEDFGLDWYAYGARYYDPALGRFTGVDPISDRFPHVSTFNYAENEPIANIDLHGLQKVSSNQPFEQVREPIVGFLSGALSMNKNVIRNASWHPGGIFWVWSKPNAITVGNTIQYDPNLKDEEATVWTELIAHETRHVQQYKEKGFFGFLIEYAQDYAVNSNSPSISSDYEAYRKISAEQEAFSLEGVLSNFFSNRKNSQEFLRILNNNDLSDNQKSGQLELLGIERVALPHLRSVKGDLQSIMTNENEDFIGRLLQFVNGAIQEKQNRADEIRNN
jgi:RHS repeat-associated protein